MANAHTIVILRQNHFSPNRHQFRGIFLMEGKGVYHCLALMPSTEELSKHFRDSTLTLLVALRWEAEAQRWKWTAAVLWWREEWPDTFFPLPSSLKNNQTSSRSQGQAAERASTVLSLCLPTCPRHHRALSCSAVTEMPPAWQGQPLPRTALGSGEKSQTAVHLWKANPSEKINLAQSRINSMRGS